MISLLTFFGCELPVQENSGLSIAAGYGISFTAGYKFSDMHGVLPFLILGLGVDDMFVIVNTID